MTGLNFKEAHVLNWPRVDNNFSDVCGVDEQKYLAGGQVHRTLCEVCSVDL